MQFGTIEKVLPIEKKVLPNMLPYFPKITWQVGKS
jgi:hypothetical protein